MTITTFPDEQIFWRNKKYAIVEVTIPSTGQRQIVLADDNWRTAYVVEYGDGNWAMDNPEWFPKYVLDKLDVIVRKRVLKSK